VLTECGPRGMTMHPKMSCADFFNICPKMAVLRKIKVLTNLLSSLVFIFSSSKIFSLDFIIIAFFYHGPLVFFY
jgi:hypothetical protein